MSKDLKSEIKVVDGLNGAVIATDTATNGAVVDMLGYNSGVAVLRLSARTDGSYLLSLSENDSNSTSGATAIATINGTYTALTAANTLNAVGFIATKRYVFLTVTSSATTSGAHVSGTIILGAPQNGPAE